MYILKTLLQKHLGPPGLQSKTLSYKNKHKSQNNTKQKTLKNKKEERCQLLNENIMLFYGMYVSLKIYVLKLVDYLN